MVREHTLLTDAALDAARMHGVRLVEGGATSLRPPADDVVHALRKKGGLPAPALSGLVRGARRPAPLLPTAGRASGAQIEGLPDYGGLQTKLLIGGEWRDAEGGQTVPTVDPATNRTIVEVAAAQPADVDRAVRAARDAFPAWRDLAPEKRSRILLRVAELIEAEHERLAKIESHDVGKPIREAALVDLPACWDPFRFYQGLVRVIDGRVLAMPRTTLDYVRKEPMGVVGMIIPWNFPLLIAAWKVAAALAAGNTVVLKAAELAPLTSLELGRICLEAGMPPGVFNVVPGPGEAAGAALAEHPGVDKVAFTGSTAIGPHRDARRRRRPSSGSRSSWAASRRSIVFADADLDRRRDRQRVRHLPGHRARSARPGSRVLVERSVHDEFVARFAERARRIRVGPPLHVVDPAGRPDQPPPERAGDGVPRDRQRRGRDRRHRRQPAGRPGAGGAATSSSRRCSPASATTCGSRRRRSSARWS